MVGGYKLAPMEPCNLPEQVATGFAQVTEHWCGAGYTPVLYVGSQVVHGVNHMLICKQQIIVPDAPEHLVTMVLNQTPDEGGITGKWSIVGIEQIV